ncbi:DNA topoisomerase IV subunit A [uncultured Faecalicoccus sp.]|uniref:DNA topoisomerase IV subunit A n=1 Tax=uncultured Faecalicoccus sp. TaxID=1971760 RepID=UPI0025903096|nr:DNA topoisomerase IV subunit A [uncultured Faecalicoccus sp.]
MTKANTVEEHHILKNSLEDIMADRFARYSKYIIQERALPDARDGLKPVQRRILYAMYEDGNTYNKPYRKSAKTVGNVIGNYHPHGDSSVYDAMVRLSQSWKIADPLIDMQGNNGSIDDDPAAAMRYTEARLSKLSDYLLQDIEKDTVEWAPNFSDEKMEPTVLPARYPNLLVNGITGIAAGYATNIPPHNLNEVVEAAIYRIQHPQCTLDELMQIVKGPDFPTGGIVMGIDGIKEAFSKGKGKVMIRSKVHVEQTRTIKQLVVTEIPYEVIKSQLVKKIDDIRINKKVDGILDVRDESDRNGLRIVIDLKKDCADETILNYLYKNTDLQISYNYNVIAIVNKAPVLMSLPMALDAFIQHREDVVLRRSHYDLKAKKDRAHILEGLIKAVSVMDEIISIIRSSKDKADAKNNLISRFGFFNEQAEAIVIMRLYRLTHTDIKELQDEYDALLKDIQRLEGIVSDKKKLHALLVKELKEVNTTFKTERRSEIQNDIQEIVIDEKAMIADEQVMVTMTHDGYVKRVSLRSYNASSDSLSGHKDGDFIVCSGQASTLQTLLFFTNRGTYGYLPVYTLEEAKWKDLGKHISTYLKIDSSEKIIQAYLIDQFDKHVEMVFASALGMIKRTSLKDLKVSRANKTMVCMKVGSADKMISAKASMIQSDHIVLVTKNGFGLTYPVEQVPQVSAKSKGVKSINLTKDDCVEDMLVCSDLQGQILFMTSEGQMKRVKMDQIARFNRPAKGNRICKLIKSNPSHLYKMKEIRDLQKEIVLESEELLRVVPASISLMSVESTFSNPFGKLEAYTIPENLDHIEEGNWSEEESEQLSLFEV